MKPESSSFDPVLECALVTLQGEPNFLPIVALMIRLAPTVTKDNYMTVECHGESWVCDCHWVMAGLGPSAVGNKSTASHFQADITLLPVFLVRCLSYQLASGLTKHCVFDSISDIFSHSISQVFSLTIVLNEPCFWAEKGTMEGK